MKKIVMLSAAVIFSMSSIAMSQAETTEAETQDATVEKQAEEATMDATPDAAMNSEAMAEDATATGDATATEGEDGAAETGELDSASITPSAEEEPIPQDTPQVKKLIALYPKLVKRIQPYGKVCFEGEDCDITVTAAGGSADGEPRDGKAVYDAVCKTCHATGLLGSPTIGDAGAWGPRIGQGKDALYDHAINGFNAMPARGGADIPDEEVINAVDYMVSESS